eukprot:m.37251 g.37251  ORF g.37251 m.37251 type:complete len:1093 (-) comp10141_c0_seq1:142-3420(-)
MPKFASEDAVFRFLQRKLYPKQFEMVVTVEPVIAATVTSSLPSANTSAKISASTTTSISTPSEQNFLYSPYNRHDPSSMPSVPSNGTQSDRSEEGNYKESTKKTIMWLVIAHNFVLLLDKTPKSIELYAEFEHILSFLVDNHIPSHLLKHTTNTSHHIKITYTPVPWRESVETKEGHVLLQHIEEAYYQSRSPSSSFSRRSSKSSKGSSSKSRSKKARSNTNTNTNKASHQQMNVPSKPSKLSLSPKPKRRDSNNESGREQNLKRIQQTNTQVGNNSSNNSVASISSLITKEMLVGDEDTRTQSVRSRTQLFGRKTLHIFTIGLKRSGLGKAFKMHVLETLLSGPLNALTTTVISTTPSQTSSRRQSLSPHLPKLNNNSSSSCNVSDNDISSVSMSIPLDQLRMQNKIKVYRRCCLSISHFYRDHLSLNATSNSKQSPPTLVTSTQSHLVTSPQPLPVQMAAKTTATSTPSLLRLSKDVRESFDVLPSLLMSNQSIRTLFWKDKILFNNIIQLTLEIGRRVRKHTQHLKRKHNERQQQQQHRQRPSHREPAPSKVSFYIYNDESVCSGDDDNHSEGERETPKNKEKTRVMREENKSEEESDGDDDDDEEEKGDSEEEYVEALCDMSVCLSFIISCLRSSLVMEEMYVRIFSMDRTTNNAASKMARGPSSPQTQRRQVQSPSFMSTMTGDSYNHLMAPQTRSRSPLCHSAQQRSDTVSPSSAYSHRNNLSPHCKAATNTTSRGVNSLMFSSTLKQLLGILSVVSDSVDFHEEVGKALSVYLRDLRYGAVEYMDVLMCLFKANDTTTMNELDFWVWVEETVYANKRRSGRKKSQQNPLYIDQLRRPSHVFSSSQSLPSSPRASASRIDSSSPVPFQFVPIPSTSLSSSTTISSPPSLSQQQQQQHIVKPVITLTPSTSMTTQSPSHEHSVSSPSSSSLLLQTHSMEFLSASSSRRESSEGFSPSCGPLHPSTPLIQLFQFAIDFVNRVFEARAISKFASASRFTRILQLFASCLVNNSGGVVSRHILDNMALLFRYGLTDRKLSMLENILVSPLAQFHLNVVVELVDQHITTNEKRRKKSSIINLTPSHSQPIF